MIRKITAFLLILSLMLSLSGCSAFNTVLPGDPVLLSREDWAPDVKTALNDFFSLYGKFGSSYDNHNYAVFDFDNTCSIFDIQEQTDYWQLCTMAYALDPVGLRRALSSGLGDLEADRSEAGFGCGSYADWIEDIAGAYEGLYQSYGPFTAAGLSDEQLRKVQADPLWQEFAAKYLGLSATIAACESGETHLTWVLFTYAGMTEDEVYELAKNCLSYYRDVKTEKITLTSPAEVTSRVGVVSACVTLGTSVTANIVELIQTFADNGLNTWICSASLTDAVRAAIDVYEIHVPLTGLLAMTLKKDENGLYLSEYDFENGCAWLAATDRTWIRDINPTGAQTFGAGKVTAIDNVLVRAYGRGPAAGFMDSTGDFNFCTEYETLKLVVCFNRADRKVTDGGGLIAEAAMYEKDTLKYTLESAVASGDTLYVLQGRDENGLRSFRASNGTLKLGSGSEKLFANEENEEMLRYMAEHKMTVKEALEKFSVKTDSGESELGFAYGFLDTYAGYHSR